VNDRYFTRQSSTTCHKSRDLSRTAELKTVSFFKPHTIVSLKRISQIFLFIIIITLQGCNGSKKYFKAAERLEKQGLIKDAAEYYLESLQRKPTGVPARIKLKEVGQKHVLNLSSEFFRNYNTQQLEASLETFEQLKDFTSRAGALDVAFDYPKTYEEDYQKAAEKYCLKNYNLASVLVNQKKYGQAIGYINLIKKYNPTYKNTAQLEIVSICEPLYQSAVNSLENKNYSSAMGFLSSIKEKTDNYKDSKNLYELSSAQQTKSFILFQPAPSSDKSEQEIQEYLFNNFGQVAVQKFSSVKIINNTPFQNASGGNDLNNSNNVDLIQAIRKATGADYFYVYDIANRREFNSGLSKTAAKGFQEFTTKTGTVVTTEYKSFDYNVVKSQRSYSYDFSYKVINAYSNQIIASQNQNISSQDAIEYQEFARSFNGNINNLFPYNPKQTSPLGQYNARNWRNLFSARNSLKTFEELKNEAYTKTINLFTTSAANMK